MAPFTVVSSSTFWACPVSLFGSVSFTSFNLPTTNARGLVSPPLQTSLTSCVPGWASFAFTLNLTEVAPRMPGCGFGVFVAAEEPGTSSPLILGSLKSSFSSPSKPVPANVTSTVSPAFTPGGNAVSSVGPGSAKARDA